MTEDDSSYTLTDSGWPRPVAGGYPVPWVSPAESLSTVNEGRRLASIGGSICQVCGGGWGYGEDALGFTTFSDEEDSTLIDRIEIGDTLDKLFDQPNDLIALLDGAIMHDRCARLAAAVCPHIAGRDDLFCVRVPANEAYPQLVDGKLRPTYAPGDVKYVAWPIARGT